MKQSILRRTLILLWIVLPLLSVQAAELSQPTYEVKVELDVKVPMSDGVLLSTNIYRPDDPGKFPVILIRTPYGNGNEKNSTGRFYAERGYAAVIQDTRGRFESGGDFRPIFNEMQDGFEAQVWAATQEWSNGKLGTAGSSYVGTTQWLPALLANKHLMAMFPMFTSGDFHDTLYIGGAFRLAFFGGWAVNIIRTPEQRKSSPVDWSKVSRHLPLITLNEKAVGSESSILREWFSHPDNNDHWNQVSVQDNYEAIQVPSYIITGWYDLFPKDSFTDFNGVRHLSSNPMARENQHIIVGSWGHGIGKGGRLGEMDYGAHSSVNAREIQLRWFDYWLKGIDTGVKDDPPVRIFVMGENVWRNEQEWPLARTQYTKYYFHSKGKANTSSGDGILSIKSPADEPKDSYVYDPEDPVPSVSSMPVDHSSVEKREDVLVYTGPELIDDVEVTGPISVELYAATTVRDTDFTAKLVDVYPDGRAIYLCDGIIRARYRESFKEQKLLEPGKVYKYIIDVSVISNVFRKGHRVRVEISSSSFPQFDRNTNTGNTFAQDAEVISATQTIYHDSDHPSHILLPIIP